MKQSSRNIHDIIVPIYNSLSYAQECLQSILAYTDSNTYRLIIINDASDKNTTRYLENLSSKHPAITLKRNSENLGFVKSCNLGITISNNDFVVLVNSDVIVTPGWLNRLIDCAETDIKIAAVNPFTNHAAQIALALAPGANFFGMDELLKNSSTVTIADVVTCVGFCLLLRRSALEDVGVFDEIYGHGYGEESDLCMRLTTQGYRTVVATNVYVYHKGSGSFKNRDDRYRHNRAIFDSRWRREYKQQFHAFRKSDPLRESRALFAINNYRWDPLPLAWKTARAMLKSWHKRDMTGFVSSALSGLWHLPIARCPLPTPASVARVTRLKRLRITYVLKKMVISGGVLSVIQLVNELILLGVEARIVALFEDPAIYEWTPLYTRPLIFRDEHELLQNFPETDIAIATLWSTALWIPELVKSGKTRTTAYFLQGYEPWFFPEQQPQNRKQVRATYDLISNKIVKSDWLQTMLANDGYASYKISLGMNLACFYPRDVKPIKPVILAMARPNAHQGGFAPTIDALAIVKSTMPQVEIALFGDRFLNRQNIPFAFRDEGLVTDHNRLAEIYSAATIFLDGSDFQGFGRGGLEAMACGVATVLTAVGGVNEYAKHGINTLLVPPQRPDIFAKAILQLINDDKLHQKLVQSGLETVKKFCHKREAQQTLEYFNRIIA